MVPLEVEALDRLSQRAAPLLGCSIAEIVGRGKSRAAVLARRRFTFVAEHRLDDKLKSIAKLTGKDPGQVSRWLRLETTNAHESA